MPGLSEIFTERNRKNYCDVIGKCIALTVVNERLRSHRDNLFERCWSRYKNNKCWNVLVFNW